MPRSSAEYLECRVFDRTCYVKFEDIRIFDGFTAHTRGVTRKFHELPENAFIVQIIWRRKSTFKVEHQRLLEGMKRHNAA